MDIKEQLFVAQQQLIGLMALQREDSEDAVANIEVNCTQLSFQAIVDAVRFPALPESASTLVQVNQSSVALQSYKLVLEYVARFSCPALAAASSSDNIYQRHAKGFDISLSDDPDNQQQAFVLLKVSEDIDIKECQSIHLHIGLHQQFMHLHLRHPYGNSFQTILTKTSPEYLAIVDADTHLYVTD